MAASDPIVELVATVVLPIALLSGGADALGLEGLNALLLALVSPIAYGAYCLYGGERSAMAVLGLVSVLLTGGLGLFELSAEWFALKEALLPGIFALFAALSVFTPWPLVEVLLVQVLDWERVEDAMGDALTDYLHVERRATWELAAIMALGALASWGLARMTVSSVVGSDLFNSQLARFSLWSFVVIGLPSMAASGYVLFQSLLRLEVQSGQPYDTFFKAP